MKEEDSLIARERESLVWSELGGRREVDALEGGVREVFWNVLLPEDGSEREMF